jgi:S-adenosylmethionine:tRNA ribosyltransferase-isomerase
MSEIAAYDYDLPRELIAQHPLSNREDARLLLVDRAQQAIDHAHVRDLPDFLDAADTLVINDTRVLPARLVGYRTRTEGRWQGLFLSADETGTWKVLSKTRGKLTAGETITLQDREGHVVCELALLARLDEGIWAARPQLDGTAEQVLARVGRVPLPPYIRDGEMQSSDLEQYQTVYAEKPGAVAAPTAGLHFTTSLLKRLVDQGTAVCKVTLHVGMATFRPIAVDLLSQHSLHTEWGSLDAETADTIRERRRAGGRAVCVGTTAVRVLETAAQDGEITAWSGETDLFIHPPFQFHAVDTLMTNFHLPRTSLLVLVRTFGGDQLIREAYREAIRSEYRFYSYGDAMFVS